MKTKTKFSGIRWRTRCGGIIAVAWLALAPWEAGAQITYNDLDQRLVWLQVSCTHDYGYNEGPRNVSVSNAASLFLPFHAVLDRTVFNSAPNGDSSGASGRLTQDSVLTSNSIVSTISASFSAQFTGGGFLPAHADLKGGPYFPNGDVGFYLDQYCRFTLSGNVSANLNRSVAGNSTLVANAVAALHMGLFARDFGSFIDGAQCRISTSSPWGVETNNFSAAVLTNGFLAAGYYDIRNSCYGSAWGGFTSGSAQGSASTSVSFTVEPMGTKLVGLEVIQTIQDWNNSVPLIAGKPTYVRAHVEPFSAPSVPIMNARLRGFDYLGNELQPPLTPLPNGARTALPNAASADRRVNWSGSVNFQLPPSWTSDYVHLVMEMDGLVRGDASLERSASFSSSPQLDLRIVKVSVVDGTNVISSPPSTAAIQQELTRLAEIFPITREAVRTTETSLVIAGDSQLSAEAFMEQIQLKRLQEAQSGIYIGALSGTLAGTHGGMSDNIPGNVTALLIDQTGTLAHELAHVLGEFHAVNTNIFGTFTPLVPDPAFLPETNYAAGPTCYGNTLAAPLSRSVNFPFWDRDLDAVIGPSLLEGGINGQVYGLANGYAPATIRVISPYGSVELMMDHYCGDTENWISTHTYGRLWAAMLARPPIAPPNGGLQPYVVIRGLVDFGSNTVTWLPFVPLSLFSPPIAPTGNTHLLKVYGRSGGTTNLTYSIPFTPDTPKTEASVIGSFKGFFTIPVPGTVPDLVRVEIIRNPTGQIGGGVVAIRIRTAAAPVIQLLSPNGGEVLGSSPLLARWNASDADGDQLTYQVQFSPDGGTNWQVLATDWPTKEFPLFGDSLPGSTNALLKVVAFDGVNTSESQSAAPFTVLNPALQVTTTSLPNGTNGAFYNQPVNASGGQLPYSWSLTPGSVPLRPGLNLSTNGTISGTQTNSDTFYFFVRVTDALSATADALLSIDISTPVQMTPPSLTESSRTGNQFQLRLTGATGQTYTVQYSTNLANTNWFSLLITNASAASVTMLDPNATNSARFYRAVVKP